MYLQKRIFHLIYIFIFISTYSQAQKSNLTFNNLTIEDGLSQSSVFDIYQDSIGYMWFCTEDGLNRYDGYTFTVYRNEGDLSRKFIDDWCSVIIRDHKGNLWIGTSNGGITQYNIKTNQFKSFVHDPENPGSISSNEVEALLIDSKNQLWIGTIGGGLNLFDSKTGTFKKYIHEENNLLSLTSNNIRAIVEDANGTLWIGTEGGGLNQYDPQTDVFFNYTVEKSDLSNNNIYDMKIDKEGMLWIATQNGLNRFDPSTEKFTIYRFGNNPLSLTDNFIRALEFDDENNLWLGMSIQGLRRLNINTVKWEEFKEVPNNNNFLISNNVWDVFKDQSGIIWVGCNGGVSKITVSKFQKYSHDPYNSNSLSDNFIWAIEEDHLGNIWVGTNSGGLNKIDPTTGKHTLYLVEPRIKKSIGNNRIRAVMEDTEGFLWLCLYRYGLDRLNPQTGIFEHFRFDKDNDNTINLSDVRCITETRSGDIWIGGSGGIDVYNKQKKKFSNLKINQDSIAQKMVEDIRVIFQDSNGHFWIGTSGNGLIRYNPKSDKYHYFVHEPQNQNSISSNFIINIHEDKYNNIWIATSNGLLKFLSDTRDFIVYNKENILPNNMIYAIESDDNGNLWISTNAGISKLNPKTEAIKNYDVTDGLQSNEFNGAASCKGESGYLYFGGINGFNRFKPSEIEDVSSVIPPVVLTSFRVFEKQIPLEKTMPFINNVELTYDQNFISFEFAVLDFYAPSQNQYAYKMDGIDKDWIYSGSRRYASYTDMGGGDYTFRVKGANSDGVWNEAGVMLNINVKPPFWKTAWFIVFISLFIIGSVVSVVRWRMGFLKKLAADLENKVKSRTSELSNKNEELKEAWEQAQAATRSKSEFLANMSHEIRTPMNGVIGLTEMMFETKLNDEQRQYLGIIKNSAEQLLGILNDILDFSKIEAGQLEMENISFNLRQTIEQVGDVIIYQVEQKKLHLNIFIDRTVPERIFGDPSRLRQVLINLIGNAVKFTSEGEINLKVYLKALINDAAELQITVSDTGIGIPKERLDAIFETFTQVDASTTRKYGGTGLGLAICKLLVNKMGGTIWVESDEGKGSQFHFTIQGKIDTMPSNDKLMFVSKLHGLKALIIDDNETNLFIVEEMLNSFGLECTTCQDELKALDLLDNNHNFQIIISDFQMPQMDGHTLIKKLRTEKKLKLPIIMLTSVGRTAEAKDVEALGSIWILTKPVKQSSLFDAVSSALVDISKNWIMSPTLEDKQKSLEKDTLVKRLREINNKVQVLLVEDNLINQKVALALLRPTGLPVSVAADGLAAIEAIKEHEYSLILMDVQMPKMDGIEATRMIRNDLKLNEIPIIAMTANAMKEDREKCLKVGMDDYISKPIKPEKLYQIIYHWLNKKELVKN